MEIIATDLDRTLIPNGDEPYDGSMPIFRKFVEKEDVRLIYITGRNTASSLSAIKRYNLPYPDYVIGKVGSKVCAYTPKSHTLLCDNGWYLEIKKQNPSYDREKIIEQIGSFEGLKLQEKEVQDVFKVSFYVDLNHEKKVLEFVRKKLGKRNDINIIYSIDHPIKRGLLDIMATNANKKDALDYLLKKEKLSNSKVYFSGDSGNDLNILLSKYNSIVVRNASQEVKRKVRNKKGKKAFIARKQKYLNGNYVSGIIQGLIHYGLISKSHVKNFRYHNPSSH